MSQAVQFRVQSTYLVEVDRGPPELLVGLVEVPITDFAEVTRVVLVEIRAVVVLTTGHTTTTWVLAVLANATVTGLHMAAAEKEKDSQLPVNDTRLPDALRSKRSILSNTRRKDTRRNCEDNRIEDRSTHCFRVFEKRVGILTDGLKDWRRRATVGRRCSGVEIKRRRQCAPGGAVGSSPRLALASRDCIL